MNLTKIEFCFTKGSGKGFSHFEFWLHFSEVEHKYTLSQLWTISSPLQSNQVKRTPQESINEFIIQKLNRC